MGMLHLTQEGQFVASALDMDLPVETGTWKTLTGVRCRLWGRGILVCDPPAATVSEHEVVLSCGVHGDETAPIELIDRLVTQVLVGVLVPAHRLLFIVGHPEAIQHHQRYLTENMNRLFKGPNSAANLDCCRANELQQAVNRFFGQPEAPRQEATRWHLDLHCAIRDSAHYTFAVSPATENPTRHSSLFAFLEAACIEAVLLSQTASPTFSWYSAEYFSAQALTLELGKVAQFGQNDLQQLAGFYQALEKWVTGSLCLSSWDGYYPQVYKVTRTLVKKSEHFALNFPSHQANFSFFEQGELLGTDVGVEYLSLAGGEAIVFPNANVAVGQRACLLVKKTAVVSNGQVHAVND
ncbi:succinylglutamate desuccinylase [Photobacterium aquae]|uniref:Succinylglutamate desuccinylase n=1 Tax=Photobacterium aquae TaxID=1195763 RepID=A0A0J1JMS2_9GAMM|nr:succinylglutamate desuccinylase [Photobacterium aquae]KLV03452.1 succinylglutamate desuccinylase [Photobacterium aquae]